MPRKGPAPKRPIVVDPVYGSQIVTQLVSKVLQDGKKQTAQRIVYAANEANYCANCQTGGRLLADRSLSRLLREDWPRTLEELERRRR